MTTENSQWAVPKEAIDAVNRSTVAFLESAAKLCVGDTPVLASLLSHRAKIVNASLPVTCLPRSSDALRCQTCNLVQDCRTDHKVQLLPSRRPRAKRVRRAIARNQRHVASQFDKHVLACIAKSLNPTVALVCRGCQAKNPIGQLSGVGAKKNEQLDEEQNEPFASSSTVSIEPNHGFLGRKRKKRTVEQVAIKSSHSAISTPPLVASTPSFSPLAKPGKRRSNVSRLQRQLAGSVEQSPNVSNDLLSFLNSLK